MDNGSTDGSTGMLELEFPWVRLIRNAENLGYTRPMNQAIQTVQGDYLVQLNPDTILKTGAFDKLYQFVETHPRVVFVL